MSITLNMEHEIATLLLDNPFRHNALTHADWISIVDRVSEAMDQGARVLIVQGEGKSFCAGADISEFDTVRRDASSARVYEQANVEAFAAVRTVPIPTIAAIRGFCIGGGFGLAAACDIRMATNSSQFAVPPAKLGMAYPVQAMQDIVDAVGLQNAKVMLYTARRYDAHQMLDMGFLNTVTAEDELGVLVHNLAEEIRALAPLTHRASKRAATMRNETDQTEAMRLGNETFESMDYAEGRAAFKEDRKPRFTGS